MSAHRAINTLFRRFTYDCKQLKATDLEMQRLANGYFKYRDLLDEQEKTRNRIIKTYGVLGHHSPAVANETEKLIFPVKKINSNEVRSELKLWEIIELFLSAVDGKATVGEFRNFLVKLGWTLPSPQAVDSAIKSHPEIFSESFEGRNKILSLK
jgi:hypothetical protein